MNKKGTDTYICTSDESEPSWRIFGSARDLFHFGSKLKIGQKQAEIYFYDNLVLKMTKSYVPTLKTPFVLREFK